MKALGFAFLLFLINTLISNVDSLLAAPRRAVSCAFLTGKIYCYGGDLPTGPQADTSLLMLDLTIPHSTSINSEWQLVDADNANVAAGPRSSAQTAVYGDGDTMVINGGYSLSGSFNQTIAYTASSNSWRTIAAFSDGVNGQRQFFSGSSIYVPTTQKIYYYGGAELNPRNNWFVDTTTNTNFTSLAINSSTSVGAGGYYRMTTLDLGVYSAWDIPKQNQFVPNYMHYLNTVIFHPSSQTLYYFGGIYDDLSNYATASITQSFGQAMTFNTSTSTWGQATFTGDVPLKRMQHTTNLLPSQQDVLLYGGSMDQDSPAVSDYCYVASLQTFTWKLHSYLTPPKDDPATRADHSAVLAGTKMFILFGYSASKTALTNNVVLILDVSNPAQLSFVSEYQGLYASSGGTNVGAIAGGVVGGVVALLIVAAVVFFYRKRKRAQEEANKASSDSPSDHDPQEHVFVDWDDIEKKFTPVENVGAPAPMMTPNTYHNTAAYSSEQQNIVVANDNKYYPPNEIESVEQKTYLERNTSLTLGLSPAMTTASASPSASTMVSPYNPGFRQSTVISSPDVSHASVSVPQSPNVHSPNDNLLISQSFTNITKPDVGSG